MDFSTNILICVTIVTAVIYLYKYLTKESDYWESQGIPCDKTSPLHSIVIGLFLKLVHKTDEENVKKYGKIFGGYTLTKKKITICDPEIIKLILVKDFHAFINRRSTSTKIKKFDSGLVLAVDKDWKRIRSVISPTFSTIKIKKMSVFITDVAEKLASNMIKLAEKREEINVKRIFAKFSAEVLGGCVFGMRFDPFTNPNHPFLVNSKRLWGSGFWKIALFLYSGYLPKFLSFISKQITKALGFYYFVNAAEEIIQKRKTELATQDYIDFMQLMLDAKENKLDKSEEDKQGDMEKNITTNTRINAWTKTIDEDEIVGQCTTFLIGGHDTVATALANTIYCLALNPKIQDKLIKEIDDTWENNEKVNYDVVHSMIYLNAVISEAMRLQSIFPWLFRESAQDYTIPNTNTVIPKGTHIHIPTHVIHHDPEYFPDPYKFDPDRFLPENKNNIRPFTYMPFGDGPRQCIAMRFAFTEIKLCLAYILRYVRFCATEETMKPLKFHLALGILQCPVTVLPEKRTDFNDGHT